MSKQTRQENRMAGISALPLIIILGLIFGAGYLLLQGEVDLNIFKPNNTLELRRIDDFPGIVTTGNEDIEKQRLIIKTEEELIEFLANIDKTNQLAFSEKIDFEKEMLIGVSTKPFENTGYSAKIRKIYINKEEESLLVSTKITIPGETCVTEPDLTIGVDIVAIDKTDMEIDFETQRTTDFCD
jgi:hypothetical protein